MAHPTRHPAPRSPAGDRFDPAFRHAPIGMALVGLDGSFLDVNPALQEIVGHVSGSIASEANASGGTTVGFTMPLASSEAPGEVR